MPLFRCSCILGGRCNQIKADEEIPEISSNKLNSSIDGGTSERSNVVIENEMEQALLYLHRPCIGSLSLGMMVHRPGILIHRDLILSSHGNLPNFEAAVDAEFVLCYLPSLRRRRSIPPKTILTRRLEPHRCFLTSEALDLTLVACEAVPENIPEIVPLSIHQHLGSMDLLEAGHQVYVLGHLQSSEMRGILASGTGRTTTFPWKDTSSNTMVAFAKEPTKGINGLWMPGSAGFDEQGEFSFMVVKPQLSYTSNNPNANTAQDLGSLKRKSLEDTTSGNMAQYGVPLYVIQDWMLMHGIRDLEKLPPPNLLSNDMSKSGTPTSAPRSVDENPLISHGSLLLSDKNSINYVVMNAGRLVLESQPRRNSSPLESFISYESSCIGNDTPLQRTPTLGLELNSVTSREEGSLVLEEKCSELPIGAGTGQGNNGMPKSMQDAVSIHNLHRSISEKVTSGSRPLKWHSRTSLTSLKMNYDNARDAEWLKTDEKTVPLFPMFGLDCGKELNIDDLQVRLTSNGVNQAPLPHEQRSDLDSSGDSAQIKQTESNLDNNPEMTNDVGEEFYEEISLDTPKILTVVDFTTDVERVNAVPKTFSSDGSGIREGDEVSSKERGAECCTSYVEPIKIVSREDKQGNYTAFTKEQAENAIEKEIGERWDRRIGHEEMDSIGSSVDNVLNVMNAKHQYVSAGSIKETRLCQVLERDKTGPNDGFIMASEEGDAYIGSNSAMNMGATPHESMPEGTLNVGAIPHESMAEGALNVGAIPSHSMSAKGFNVDAFSFDSMSVTAANASAIPIGTISGKTLSESEGKKKQPCTSASISSSLRPEEVSKRIQGYGNVSNIMQSANMRNTNSKEEKGGSRRSSGSGPPLKSLFGSSLVSGRWMKSSSSNKAPHSDDSPS
ncbi:hypothetical protein L7F22_006135 [Adiantum nelumboides]|nr:hypothetical protein [Adiantum nelumboides]